MDQPRLIIFGGPNGSGKSTLATETREFGVNIIDPDRIAREFNASPSDAGRLTLARIRENLVVGLSFGVESTLSGKTLLRHLVEAKQRGYDIELFFVATATVEITLARIAARVALGGHDIPEDVVRRRFPRSINNAELYARLADYVLVADNSTTEPIPIVERHGRFVHDLNPTPMWAQSLVASIRSDNIEHEITQTSRR